MRSLTTFFAANKRLSKRLTPDHVHESDVFGMYRKIGTIVLSRPDVRKVADVGAGTEWQFPDYYKDWYGLELFGLDIAGEDMDRNTSLDHRLVCDVTGDVPLESDSIDLVMAHSGVEHFQNNELFLRNVMRILRPGGYMLAQFPGRFAPFAIANRILPSRATQTLLKASMGGSDMVGFEAHYDQTNYSAFKKLVEKVGFDIAYYNPGYFSSSYFEFFSPLFLLSYVFDMFRYALGLRNAASYNLFLLQKPPLTGETQPLRLYAWK